MVNKVKVILWLSAIIAVAFTCFLLRDTLGLFENNNEGQTDVDLAKWVIKLNNEMISSGSRQTLNVSDFSYTENENVREGKIAPGVDAYVDLVLDATESDVAVRYDIFFDLSEFYCSSNLSVSVSEIGGSSSVLSSFNTYSGVISLDKINNDETVTLRAYLRWDLNDANNDLDSSYGTSGRDLVIPVTVTASQYTGEDIVYDGVEPSIECAE